jgi:hypothetical protein
MSPANPLPTFASQISPILSEVLAFAGVFSESTGSGPELGSQADREWNHNVEFGPGGAWGTNPVEFAYAVAGTALIPAAGQYLAALSQLLNDEMALFGFQAVVRSLVESAARSWWILDPDIDARERVERAYEERWYSLHELRKANNSVRPQPLKTHEPLMVKIAAGAAQLGLTERRSGDRELLSANEIRGYGSQRPTSTDLIPRFLEPLGLPNGELWYRSVSGVTHSVLYATMNFWEPGAVKASGMHKLEPQLPLMAVANAATLGVVAYLGSIERHALTYGRQWKAIELKRKSTAAIIRAIASDFMI